METAIGRFPHSSSSADGPCSVYIRPQAVRVSTDQGGMPAKIIQRNFRGDREQLVLMVDGLDMPLVADVSEALPDGLPSVQISFVPEKMLMF